MFNKCGFTLSGLCVCVVVIKGPQCISWSFGISMQINEGSKARFPCT